jgi:hypothetical protein
VPLLLKLPQQRGILVRQRHRAEGNPAGETRGEPTEAVSLGRGDGEFQAVEDEHWRIGSDVRVSRD